MGMLNNEQRNPAFRQGDNPEIRTLILLSAPGRVEKEKGRPAAGRTGETLREALKTLHLLWPSSFPSESLNDYTIANSVEKVHYKADTGRTEATDKEVLEAINIHRLTCLVAQYDAVLALGKKAHLAIDSVGFQGQVIKSFHPSMQALNRKFLSEKSTPKERSDDRIAQWVHSMTT